MPRRGPRRPLVGIKLSDEGRAHVDQRARDEGVLKRNGDPNRSEMIRLMLAYASAHMPRGWRP
ncbi:MAG: CopG family transcriptional regulator [Haloechinothrix sp.]